MKRSGYILGIIFVLTLATRLIIAFQTPYFTGEDSYFSIRQIEHIRSTGFPIFNDELSYGGTEHIFTPFFYYFLAFFNLFIPIGIVGKLIPNLLVSLIVVIVYFISKEISNDENASLFSSFISGFIPVFFKETVNTISVYTMVFPMMLLMIYCFLRIEQKNNVYCFLITLFFLVLTSPTAIILIFGLIFYMFLLRLENLEQRKIELELILFSLVFTTWVLFVMFKNAFLVNSTSVIWQNIPKDILKGYFSDITILGAIYRIGSLPLSYGVYSVYDHLFREKERKFYVLIGFAFSTTILLWMKLIEVYFGLMCIGLIATLLFPKFYNFTFEYLKKTRFARFRALYFALLFLAFVSVSVVPSIISGISSVNNALTETDFMALRWIKEHTAEDSVVIAPVKEGILISSLANRRNVADTDFLLQKDAEQRLKDIEMMYNSRFETEALGILNKYKVDYIYFSDYAKDKFGINDLVYTEDKRCFSLKYDKGADIFKVECELQ